MQRFPQMRLAGEPGEREDGIGKWCQVRISRNPQNDRQHQPAPGRAAGEGVNDRSGSRRSFLRFNSACPSISCDKSRFV